MVSSDQAVLTVYEHQGLYAWFHTYGRKRASTEKFKNIKSWTGRSVLGVEANEDLKTIIWNKTGGWAGSSSDQKDNQRAFRMYQTELSKLWDLTLKAEQEHMEKLAIL